MTRCRERRLNMSKAKEKMVIEEVEIFKAEYPEYTDEHISDYLELCEDYGPEERDLFCRLLGY
jgi:hypothetical protein